MRGLLNNTVAGIASADISASGYTVTVRREGLVVKTTTSGITGVRVPITSPGKVKIGDTLVQGTGTEESTVDTIANDYVILVWTGGGTRTFTAPNILSPTNDLPTIFSQEVGGVETANPITPVAGVFSVYAEGDGIKYDLRAQKTASTTYFVGPIAPKVSRPAQIGEITDVDPSYAKAESIRVGGVEIASIDMDGTEHIPAGSIGTAELADKAVTGAKIDDGAVDTLQLADGAVTPTQLDRTYVETAYNQTIKNPAGTPATQRSVLKFTGSTVTVSDTGGETVVDIAASTPAQGDITAVSQVVESDVSVNHTLTDDNAEHVRVTTTFSVAATCVGLLIQYQAQYEVDSPTGTYLKVHLYVGGTTRATCLLGPGNTVAGFSVLTANIAWIEAAPSAGNLVVEIREQKSAAGDVWTDLANTYQGARIMITELKK